MKKNVLPFVYFKMFFWLLGCVLLAGVVIKEYEVFFEPPLHTVAENNQKNAQDFFEGISEYKNDISPKDDYEKIVSFPLFIEGRTALKHNDSSLVQGSSNFKLTGVVSNKNSLLALVRDDKNNQFRVKSGEQINGWTVTLVEKEAIELKNDEQIQKLLLVEEKKVTDSAPNTTNMDIYGGYNSKNPPRDYRTPY